MSQSSSRGHSYNRRAWRRRQRRRQQHRHSTSISGPPPKVGTEAVALANLESNQKNFKYPSTGFVERIEFSLLYSMILEPKIYPQDIVLQHIQDEDFYSYMVVNDTHTMHHHQENKDEEEEDVVSYAQLSAILAVSAEKFPPPESQQSQLEGIPQALCKRVVQAVISYAESHDLDRREELRELLQPVEQHAIKRNQKAAMRTALPFYVGYAATIVTANPLPMMMGAAVTISAGEDLHQENENISRISTETIRRADVEKTSLLEECEEIYVE